MPKVTMPDGTVKKHDYSKAGIEAAKKDAAKGGKMTGGKKDTAGMKVGKGARKSK